MKPRLVTGTGVVLRVGKAGEGGRLLRLFSATEGQISCFVSKGTLKKYGPGFLFPYAHLRYTLAVSPESRMLVQYEGRLLLDMTTKSYEEIAQWYYAAEIAMIAFPEGTADEDVFYALETAAAEASRKNPTLVAFILAIRLLVLAGFDPAEEDPMQSYGLSEETKALLLAFRRYDGRGTLSVPVTKANFRACAEYIDAFAERTAGLEMKTKGAFLKRHEG